MLARAGTVDRHIVRFQAAAGGERLSHPDLYTVVYRSGCERAATRPAALGAMRRITLPISPAQSDPPA